MLEDIGFDPDVFVAPRYLRLAMGGSHSVYILMRINLEHVGRSLYRHSLSLASHCQEKDEDIPAVGGAQTEELTDQETDAAWYDRHARTTMRPKGDSNYTVEGWCEAVRRAKHMGTRVFTIMHFFSGERRADDVQSWVEKRCNELGIKVLMLSVDLAVDPAWDYEPRDLLSHHGSH